MSIIHALASNRCELTDVGKYLHPHNVFYLRSLVTYPCQLTIHRFQISCHGFRTASPGPFPYLSGQDWLCGAS